MKRSIEIDDSLDERVKNAIDEVKEAYKDWLIEDVMREPIDEETLLDTWYQGRDGKNYGCDLIHEVTDSHTPIYNSEIDGLYYLYGNEFEESYKNAGFGSGEENNHRQVAIYCYINEKVNDYVWGELKDFEEDFIAYRSSVKGLNDSETLLKQYIDNALKGDTI